MKHILDAMQLGIVVLDANLDTVIINQAYFKIWDIAPEDVPIAMSARDMPSESPVVAACTTYPTTSGKPMSMRASMP